MWNSCSDHHVVEGIGPHKGPSEYILAHLGDDVKRETKLFPRLPKFQPSATHHLRHPPSATPSKYPSRSLTSVAHPKLPQFQAPATHSPPSPTFSSPLSSPLSHSPSPSLACPSPVLHLSLIKPQAQSNVHLKHTPPVPHPAPGQTHSPATVRHHAWIKNSPTVLLPAAHQVLPTPHPHTPPVSATDTALSATDQAPAFLTSQPTCTYNPFTATSLPSFGRMGNFPPAAHAGPTHRLDEIQARKQHTEVKLSENSDGESSVDGAVIVTSFTSRWSVDNSASPHPGDSSSPRTHNSPTSLTGGDHHSLKSAQFSFAFAPSLEARDPSTSNPAPGRPTHPHHTVLISSLPEPRHPTCPNCRPRFLHTFNSSRPRSCLAVLNSDRDSLPVRLAESRSSDPER